MSRWETSALDGCSVSEVEAWASALRAKLVIDLRVDGERPLADARHAAIQNRIVHRLRSWGWLVEPEASFNHYGDRGRVDVLAYHPTLQIVLVVEVKTRIDDTQDLIGRLDVKRRVVPILARERRWQVRAVVPVLLVSEGRTARRRIGEHPALFATMSLRARAAIAWLRRPALPAPSGILAFVSSP
jgi:hypothetical protein